MADLLFLLYNLMANELLIVLYSSGLWLDFPIGMAWFAIRCLALLAAHHFSYPSILRLLIAGELIAGLFVTLIDIWVYYATNCECILQVDGAILRLVVRGGVLLTLFRFLK